MCSSLLFEKAYCEYRLNRTEDALATIQSVPNPDSRLQELHGQVVCTLCNIKFLLLFLLYLFIFLFLCLMLIVSSKMGIRLVNAFFTLRGSFLRVLLAESLTLLLLVYVCCLTCNF